MTGLGRGEASIGAVVVTAEARSVNHRHLDIALRLPRALAAFELEARRLIQTRLERGRVDVAVQLAAAPDRPSARITADVALARDYLARARALAAELGLAGEVDMRWVLERPGVIRTEEADVAVEVGWPPLAEALSAALDDLVARRAAEGEVLAAELAARHAELGTTVQVIQARAPVAIGRREMRLRERIRALGEGGVDEHRLATEIAVWADKTDISEELVRLRAHLGEFRALLDKGGPVTRGGRWAARSTFSSRS
jgi:uncharacterized protein (TIGR00255 family)